VFAAAKRRPREAIGPSQITIRLSCIAIGNRE